MEENFLCRNCNRRIPVSNRTIHELRCVPSKVPAASVVGDQQKVSQHSTKEVKNEVKLPIAQPVRAPSAPSAPSAVPAAKAGWACERCTYFNENVNSHECEICGTSYLAAFEEEGEPQIVPDEFMLPESPPPTRPARAPAAFSSTSSSNTSSSNDSSTSCNRNATTSSNSWQCNRCTLINSLANDECTACGETRPAQETRRERLINDEEEHGHTGFVYVDGNHPMMQQGYMVPPPPPAPRTSQSNVPTSALFGATMGAGLAFLNNQSVTRGAVEGAGMGLLGGIMLDMLNAETERMERQASGQRIFVHRGVGAPGGPANIDMAAIEMLTAQLFHAGGMPHRPQGVDEETLRQLPTHVHRSTTRPTGSNPSSESSNSDQNSCSICLCGFEDGDNLKTLPCLHRFHVNCVDQWLVRSNVCPICKHSIN